MTSPEETGSKDGAWEIYFSRTEVTTFKYVPRLLFNFLAYLGFWKPEGVREIEAKVKAEDLNPNFEHELDAAVNSNAKLIFVQAEWGSGKTHQLLAWQKKRPSERSFVYRSYFGVQTLEQAYLRAIPPLVFVVSALLAIGIAIGLTERWVGSAVLDALGKRLAIVVPALASLGLIVSNQWRLFFLFSYAVWSLGFFLPRKGLKRRLIVLDDLDRSGLTANDRWGLLSNLWLPNHQYVVPLGHMRPEERLEFLEVSRKLAGVVVPLRVTAIGKFMRAKSMWKEFPFEQGVEGPNHWLNSLTFRELISGLEHFLLIVPDTLPTDIRQIACFHYFHHLIISKFGVNGEQIMNAGYGMGNGQLDPPAARSLGEIDEPGRLARALESLLRLFSPIPKDRFAALYKKNQEILQRLSRERSTLEFVQFMSAIK